METLLLSQQFQHLFSDSEIILATLNPAVRLPEELY